jgi:MFS family permease
MIHGIKRNDPVTDDPAWSRSGIAYLVATWLLSAAAQVYVIVPASVVPRIATDFGVSQTTAVWLISAVLVAWAGTNFGVGVVVDRVGDYIVVAVSGAVVVGTALAGWVAAADGLFWPLIGTRVVAGVAVGAVWIASTTLVGRLFTVKRRATALGIFTTSAPAGFAVGQVLGPRITDAAGWPAIFAVGGALTAIALVVFGLVHLVDGEASRTRSEGATDDSDAATVASIRQRFAVTLRNRTVAVGAGAAFVAYSLYLFLNSWLPTYLIVAFDLSVEVSGLLAAVFPAMGIISRAGGGVVSDRLFGHRRLPVLKWSFVITTPVVFLLGVSTSIPILVALLVLGGLVIQLTFGVVYSYVQEAVEPENAGTALSILGSAGISGAFSAPVIAGALIDLTGTYAAAFAYAVGIAAVGVGLVFVAADQ